MPRDGGLPAGGLDSSEAPLQLLDTNWLKTRANVALRSGDREQCERLINALYLHLDEGLTVMDALLRV